MSDDLTLPADNGARSIWVFTAALDAEAFARFARPGESWPLAEALGLPGLGPGSVETFHSDDLTGYGLERYLTEAHGMDPASTGPDTARLAAVTGPVVLLFSRELPEGATALDPVPPLAFVGRYDAPVHLVPSPPMPPRKSTLGHIETGAGPENAPARLIRPLALTLAALLLLAGLVLLLA